MKQRAIICDIDGTIADISHRLHHIQHDPKNWDAFHEECGNDKPIYPIIQIVHQMYKAGYEILMCTGRPMRNLEKTRAWLDFHVIPYRSIYMRPNKDFRSDYILKEEMLKEIQKDFNIHYVLEDRARVVKMYRDNNLTCLQVKEGDY